MLRHDKVKSDAKLSEMLAAQRKRVGDRYLLYLMTTTFHGFPLCRLRFVENVVPAICAPFFPTQHVQPQTSFPAAGFVAAATPARPCTVGGVEFRNLQ